MVFEYKGEKSSKTNKPSTISLTTKIWELITRLGNMKATDDPEDTNFKSNGTQASERMGGEEDSEYRQLQRGAQNMGNSRRVKRRVSQLKWEKYHYVCMLMKTNNQVERKNILMIQDRGENHRSDIWVCEEVRP